MRVPTSWSLSDFCWAPEVAGSRASPNAEINARLKALRRFMVFFLWSLNGICATAQVTAAGGNRDVKERRSQIEIVPAGGTSAANFWSGNFGTSPLCMQPSDKLGSLPIHAT
jgi:hypothetical protein